ncbi:hypothetical protein MRX96_006283 [Rhipicephalus microplus]
MVEAPGHETMLHHPAAAFLKDATGARNTRNPQRKRKRNRRKRRAFPVLQSTLVSPPSSGNQCTPTKTTGPPPCTPRCPQTRGSPPTSETVDDEGLQTVYSKTAFRCTKNRTSAALPVDPWVVGTVLDQPAFTGGSFRNCPRLTIA